MAQYSFGTITQISVGHFTTLELKVVSTTENVIPAIGFFSFVSFKVKLRLGLVGAAGLFNLSWCIVAFGHFAYVSMDYCLKVWTGFTTSAFCDLVLNLGINTMILKLMAGSLKNVDVAVALITICVKILNELRAGRPKVAKFSIIVVVLSSTLVGMNSNYVRGHFSLSYLSLRIEVGLKRIENEIFNVQIRTGYDRKKFDLVKLPEDWNWLSYLKFELLMLPEDLSWFCSSF
ncbi:hypothetical protein GIB67_015323 [Kingdonia uniflora]|uniref:Uncharacterized protein n=1 Tax=Kingdonia uniflora TaxID=39325 RepID=A0A7J7KYM2_9MAGN|nr:hypothetical protein GIB67_015323 [Kingdonia uniflora]